MSPTAGLRSPPSEQEAGAQDETAPSAVATFDWPGAVAVCVALTKRGWLAHTRHVGTDRWAVEARRRRLPSDGWKTLRVDGYVR
jgi:hypothetical protein